MTIGAGPAVELPVPCVVLCPPLDARDPMPAWFAACRAALIAHSFDVLIPEGLESTADPAFKAALPPVGWVAAVSSVIRRTPSRMPLLITAVGAAVTALPALAVSQRAARRSVVGYVLVDTEMGTFTGDWPGSPVTYVRTPGAPELGWRRARLHGWHTVEADPVTAVLDAAARAAGAY